MSCILQKSTSHQQSVVVPRDLGRGQSSPSACYREFNNPETFKSASKSTSRVDSEEEESGDQEQEQQYDSDYSRGKTQDFFCVHQNVGDRGDLLVSFCCHLAL